MATIPTRTCRSPGLLLGLIRNPGRFMRRSVLLVAAAVLMAMKAHVAEEVSRPAGEAPPARLHSAGISSPGADAVIRVADRSPDQSWSLKYYRRLL